eukprot:7417238-Alexandrium_andersonii.AAC.1
MQQNQREDQVQQNQREDQVQQNQRELTDLGISAKTKCSRISVNDGQLDSAMSQLASRGMRHVREGAQARQGVEEGGGNCRQLPQHRRHRGEVRDPRGPRSGIAVRVELHQQVRSPRRGM